MGDQSGVNELDSLVNGNANSSGDINQLPAYARTFGTAVGVGKSVVVGTVEVAKLAVSAEVTLGTGIIKGAQWLTGSTLGFDDQHEAIQEHTVKVGAAMEAIGKFVTRVVTEPVALTTDLIEAGANRLAKADKLEAQGLYFEASVERGELGADVGGAVWGGASALKAVAKAGAKGLTKLGVPDLEVKADLLSALRNSDTAAPTTLVRTPTPEVSSPALLPEKVDVPMGRATPVGDEAFQQVYKLAPAAKLEVDELASAIAKKYDADLATAPVKSAERAWQKVVNDYDGNASRINDLARNTIIAGEADIPRIVDDLAAAGAKVKVINAADDALGYSGINASIKTKAGIHAEIQVNTPAMIFAKESPEIAGRLLGATRYAEIAKQADVPGGLGHKLYEQHRVLDKGSDVARAIASQSRQYYDSVRGRVGSVAPEAGVAESAAKMLPPPKKGFLQKAVDAVVRGDGDYVHGYWGDLNKNEYNAVRKYIERTEAGRKVVQALDNRKIFMKYTNELPEEAGLVGVNRGGSAKVFLRMTEGGREYALLGAKLDALEYSANISLHEGLHGLGVRGSKRAEALVRLEELRSSGISVDQRAMRQVLKDMGTNYNHLRWRSGGSSAAFPGLEF
ncbi:MAG: hypothetical protein C4K60_11875 [Ideonella sp. MAG2]|nr:MAG: hypothetical protein C4K60_11875 [Ideonella sp. MAG2]